MAIKSAARVVYSICFIMQVSDSTWCLKLVVWNTQ